MLARRRERRVGQARNHDVDVRTPREAAVLRVVVGALHVLDARRHRDRAAQVRAGPGLHVKLGRPSSARLTLPDDPRNLYRRMSSTKSSGR